MSASSEIAYSAPKSVSISDFKSFSASTISRLTGRGMEANAAKDLWLERSRWVCTRCGGRLDPEGLREVLDLKGQAKPTLPSAKSILKGQCSKEECDSGFVWLKLERCPEIDWASFFGGDVDAEVELASDGEADLESESAAESSSSAGSVGWRWWGPRVLIGAAMIVLALTLARELGLGSRVRSLTVDAEEFRGSSQTDYLGATGE